MIFNSLTLHEYLWWKNIFNQKKSYQKYLRLLIARRRFFIPKAFPPLEREKEISQVILMKGGKSFLQDFFPLSFQAENISKPFDISLTLYSFSCPWQNISLYLLSWLFEISSSPTHFSYLSKSHRVTEKRKQKHFIFVE